MTLPTDRFADREPFPEPKRVLREGVPEYLEQSLRDWIYAALGGGSIGGPPETVALRLQIPIKVDWGRGINPAAFLARKMPRDELLSIVNAILAEGGPWPAPGAIPFENRQAVLIIDLIKILKAVHQPGM